MIKGLQILLFAGALFSFDASAAWIKRADFGSHGRHRGTALSIGNRGYMGLGHYNGAGPNIVLKDWWEYDAATNSWSQKADYIANNGNGNYAPLAMGFDDVGYLAGGSLGDAMLYKYDPSLNIWSAVVTCPITPGNRAAFVIGTKGYYVQGTSVYEFDRISETWSIKNIAPFTAGVWNSSFSIEGKGYLKNGTTLWEYKPTIDAWTPRAPFPGLATAGSVSFMQDNKGYIVAGYSGWLSEVTSETWEYDPLNNSWTQLEDFSGTSRRFGSSFNIGNKGYIGIGTNGTNFNDFWEFDRYADLKENFDVDQFTTYPNPATNFINFKSENLNSFTIEVFDMLGRSVFSEKTNKGEVRFSKDFNNSGTYIYHVKVDGTIVHSNKFILN